MPRAKGFGYRVGKGNATKQDQQDDGRTARERERDRARDASNYLNQRIADGLKTKPFISQLWIKADKYDAISINGQIV